MAIANPYQSYRAQQVNTSQDKLILMLFDGAIRFCRQAEEALTNKRLAEANTNLIKAQNILQEFKVTLNMEYEIAHNLYELYDYLYRRLVEANLKKNSQIIAEVVTFLTELRETFSIAGKQARLDNQVATGGAFLEG